VDEDNDDADDDEDEDDDAKGAGREQAWRGRREGERLHNNPYSSNLGIARGSILGDPRAIPGSR
jgi:hypothetical protein